MLSLPPPRCSPICSCNSPPPALGTFAFSSPVPSPLLYSQGTVISNNFDQHDHLGCSVGVHAVLLIPLLIALAMDLRTWSVSSNSTPPSVSWSSYSGGVWGSLFWNTWSMQVFPLVWLCWMVWEGHRRPLNQGLDPLGAPLPDVLPGVVLCHRLLPLHSGTILLYGHCSAWLIFLH